MQVHIPRPSLPTAIGFAGAVGWFVFRGFLEELIFGDTANWLKSHFGVVGDFLAWDGSTIIIGILLAAVVLMTIETVRASLKAAIPASRGSEGETTIVEPDEFTASPYIEVEHQYGSQRDGVAAHVILKVSRKNGSVVQNARGRLASVKPITDNAAIASVLQFPPGILQWSSRYGGKEVCSFKTEAELDILAFENNDDSGKFIYANESLRGKQELLLGTCPWEITIEIFAESGESLTCSFTIKKGSHRVFAHASRRGTLYEPELEQISCV